jgi:uncharacterized membrane protein YdjX (TVP38/TMEM64 family)
MIDHLMESPQPDPALAPPPTAPGATPTALYGNLIRVGLILAIVGGSADLLLRHAQLFENPAGIKTEVLSWGLWGPAAFVVLYAVGPSFLIPGAIMTAAAGAAFGPWWGSLWSLIGANLGALIAFTMGRYLGRGFVEGAVGARFKPFFGRIARNGFNIILYLRIVPVIPYNALNLIAGASPIGFSDYFWASIIGMVPGTIAFAFFGSQIWNPRSPKFFLGIAMILASIGAGELYRRRSQIKLDT